MAAQRRRKLDAVVARLQLDYGSRAIRRAEPGEQTPLLPRIATTFAELDAVLAGGLPQGRITEVSGPATSGKLTLAAKTIASAHHADRDALAAWLDLNYTCDPDYLSRCGIDLDRLLVVHPATLIDALAVVLHLVESDALTVLVFDASPSSCAPEPFASTEAAANLARLPQILTATTTAVVFLSDATRLSRALAYAATVRIVITQEQWITQDGDVRGYTCQAEVVKNRLGRAGVRVPVRITFNGTVRGNGLW